MAQKVKFESEAQMTDLDSRAILPDEAHQVIEAARTYSYSESVNALWSMFFTVLWQTGLRCGEVLVLTVKHVQPDHLLVRREKKRKGDDPWDKLWVTPELSLALQQYIIRYSIRSRLFPRSDRDARYIFGQIKERLNLRPSLTLHSFRHGFGRNFVLTVGGDYQNPLDALASLQRWLGHANMKTTSIYFQKSAADLKKDLRKLRF